MGTQRFLAAGTAALLLVAMGAAAVAAQDGGLGEKMRSGTDVTIGPSETIDHDLYAFAGNVRVDGTVNGDLVASGSSVTITGVVTGDVVAAGATVDVRGRVDGDLRLAGGTVTVDGAVGEDALTAGGTVRVGASGKVGEDLFASAGQLSIDGDVRGNVEGAAGTYARAGTIGGIEDVSIAPATVTQPSVTDRVLDAVRYVLAVVAFGLLALWLAPRLVRRAERTLVGEPIAALGWGLATVLGVLVAAIVMLLVVAIVAALLGLLGFGQLVALDIVGGILAVGGLGVAFAILAGFLADAIVGFALASLIVGRRGEATGDAGEAAEGGRARSRDVELLVIGAIGVAIVASIPIIGPWVKLLVVLFGVGALAAAWWYGRRGSRARPGRMERTTASTQPARPMP